MDIVGAKDGDRVGEEEGTMLMERASLGAFDGLVETLGRVESLGLVVGRLEGLIFGLLSLIDGLLLGELDDCDGRLDGVSLSSPDGPDDTITLGSAEIGTMEGCLTTSLGL